jgi:hypothetical protein
MAVVRRRRYLQEQVSFEFYFSYRIVVKFYCNRSANDGMV